jgi:hypothetical protein
MLKSVISKVNNHRATNPLGDKAASQTPPCPGVGEEFAIRLKPFHSKVFEQLAVVKQAERERLAALFSRSDTAWRSAHGCWRPRVGFTGAAGRRRPFFRRLSSSPRQPSRSARDSRGIFYRARPSWKVLIFTVFN